MQFKEKNIMPSNTSYRLGYLSSNVKCNVCITLKFAKICIIFSCGNVNISFFPINIFIKKNCRYANCTCLDFKKNNINSSNFLLVSKNAKILKKKIASLAQPFKIFLNHHKFPQKQVSE